LRPVKGLIETYPELSGLLISSKIEGVIRRIRYGLNYGGLYGVGHFGKFETWDAALFVPH
jgi:hypothetical protein